MRSKNDWHDQLYDKTFANLTIGSQRFLDLAQIQTKFLMSTLQLHDSAKILDVPCGVGRHSQLFAQKGFQVNGLDISHDCIDIAKRKFSHKNVVYKKANMANLEKYKAQFDAVLNLFTSFGYFYTDKENENVLRGMKSCLKPGGKIVLNLIDRDYLMKVYQASHWSKADGILTVESSKYSKETKSNESHMFLIDSKSSKVLYHTYFRVRLYDRIEMLALLKKVGFKKIKVYGNFNGDRYQKGISTHPIYIAE